MNNPHEFDVRFKETAMATKSDIEALMKAFIKEISSDASIEVKATDGVIAAELNPADLLLFIRLLTTTADFMNNTALSLASTLARDTGFEKGYGDVEELIFNTMKSTALRHREKRADLKEKK